MRLFIFVLAAACLLPVADAHAKRPRTYDKPLYLMPEHAKDTNYNTAARTQDPFTNPQPCDKAAKGEKDVAKPANPAKKPKN